MNHFQHAPEPKVINPFDAKTFLQLKKHIRHVRKMFDWPGIPYHDAHHNENDRFNRWQWHNLPLLRKLHHEPDFIKLVSSLAGRPLKPSYVFLSMYGPEGVCPVHTDRPQCQFTVDLQIESDGNWPIYVSDRGYSLEDGEALFYSGTGQVHYRKPMAIDSKKVNGEGPATYMNLAFFHFVPTEWQGDVK